MSIVVVGSINADLVIKAARAPEAGETLLGRDFSTGVGGKGLNQCAAIALQSPESKVSMVACTGNDAHGKMCRTTMRDIGIDLTHVKVIDRVATGVALIVVEDSGDNRILLDAGANGALTKDIVDEASEKIKNASLVVFQLESPLATIEYALSMAHGAGVKTLLNPAPAAALPDELLRQVTYLIPNESEAGILADMPVRNVRDAELAGRALLDRGLHEAVIITLGGEGCVVVTKDKAKHMPANKVKAVDTTA